MPKTVLKIIFPALVILLFTSALVDVSIQKFALKEEVREILKERMDQDSCLYFLEDELIFSADLLVLYYQELDYSPTWLGNEGLLPMADSLICKIKEAAFDGLNSADYHLSTIAILRKNLLLQKSRNKDLGNLKKWADLDMLLTDAFLTYAGHQYFGYINFMKTVLQLKNRHSY